MMNIPEGVTSIGDKCFKACVQLSHVELPMTTQRIGTEAFSSETVWRVPLRVVEVPKNCVIGKDAFGKYCKVILK